MDIKRLIRFLAKEQGYTLTTLSAKCGYAGASSITRGLYDDTDLRIGRVQRILKGLNCSLVVRTRDGDEFKVD